MPKCKSKTVSITFQINISRASAARWYLYDTRQSSLKQKKEENSCKLGFADFEIRRRLFKCKNHFV